MFSSEGRTKTSGCSERGRWLTLTAVLILVTVSALEVLPVVLIRFIPGDYNFGVTPWGERLRRWNNVYYSAYISWACFTTLTVIAAVWWMRRTSYLAGILGAAAVLSLNYAFVWPLLNAWNVVLAIVCHNGPMNLDIDVFFPEARERFEEPGRFNCIRAEVARYLDAHVVPCLHASVPNIRIDPGNRDRCWRFLPLKTVGRMNLNHATNFPVFYEALNHPSVVNAVVSSLDPGTHIPPHRGYFKGYLRYHLGIEVPTDRPDDPAYIVCGGERYEWVLGEGVLFDDMFIHYVHNPSPHQRRTVLYLDVRRRHLPRCMHWINDGVHRLIEGNPFVRFVSRDQHRQRPQQG